MPAQQGVEVWPARRPQPDDPGAARTAAVRQRPLRPHPGGARRGGEPRSQSACCARSGGCWRLRAGWWWRSPPATGFGPIPRRPRSATAGPTAAASWPSCCARRSWSPPAGPARSMCRRWLDGRLGGGVRAGGLAALAGVCRRAVDGGGEADLRGEAARAARARRASGRAGLAPVAGRRRPFSRRRTGACDALGAARGEGLSFARNAAVAGRERHEDDRRGHQAQPPRRGARRGDRGRRFGPDGHRGARLRPPARQDRGLSRRRIRGEAAAEGEAGDRRAHRHRRRRGRGDRAPPPTPARSATARSSSWTWSRPCASAPASKTRRIAG